MGCTTIGNAETTYSRCGDADKGTCCYRWAVYQAASALRKHLAEYDALVAAMKRGAPVAECVQAIETA
jgi:hypothetical protein